MKKFKVLLITLITLILLIAIIVIIVIFLKNKPSKKLDGLHLEDILFGKLKSKEFNGTWTKVNNSIIYKDEKNVISSTYIHLIYNQT